MMVFLHLQRFTLFCILFLLVLPVTGGAQGETDVPVIESITVLAEEGVPERLLIRLNASHTPKTFKLDGHRPRLVFDFYNVRYLFDQIKIGGAGGDIISGVRVGRHNNPLKTRVVVDIVPGRPYQYDQIFDVSNNSLEIRFLPGVPEEPEPGGKQHLRAESLKVVRKADNHADTPVAAPTDTPTGIVTETPADVVAGEDKQKSVEEKSEPEEKVPGFSGSAEPEAKVAVIGAAHKKRKALPELPDEPAQKDSDRVTDGDVVLDTGAAVPEQGDVQESQETPTILDISFEKSINNSETVLFKLSHFHPPLVFGIEQGTPRVVCDFVGSEIKARVPEVIDSGGTYVTRITVSNLIDPKKVRVELELAANHHYDLQQLFFKEDNLFVVIVNELDE